MIAGREALREIDDALKAARETVRLAGDEAQDAQQDLVEIRQAEAKIFSQITDIRLTSMGAGEDGIDALKRVDRQAAELIAQHDTHIEKLENARDQAADRVSDLEDEREKNEEALVKLIEKHETASNKTREKLEKDANYLSLCDAVEKANAIVDHAASKREVALADRTEKGKPYENDPLFSYLWERQYATKAYRAGPITRMLDGWVAKLIRYRDARLNYERLLDIPVRLGEHLDAVEEKAANIAAEVEAYERKALERDGVDALRDRVNETREHRDQVDRDLDIAEQAHMESVEALTAAVKGDDGPLQKARDLINQVLQEKSVPDLKILAAETRTLEDDRLVETLADLRLDRFSIEDSVKSHKSRLTGAQRNLQELEKIRRRFKHSRFDSYQSEFKSADLIRLLLSDFSRGTLGAHDVWRRIEKAHRTRRRDWHDDFGGDGWRDGFGLPGQHSKGRSSGSSWGGHTDWGRLGRDITREIERELGRELGDLLGTGGLGRSRGRAKPRRRSRRRPRSISMPRSGHRSRSSRRSGGRSGGSRGGRRGGGGFRTGGGF